MFLFRAPLAEVRRTWRVIRARSKRWSSLHARTVRSQLHSSDVTVSVAVRTISSLGENKFWQTPISRKQSRLYQWLSRRLSCHNAKVLLSFFPSLISCGYKALISLTCHLKLGQKLFMPFSYRANSYSLCFRSWLTSDMEKAAKRNQNGR